MNSNFIVFTAAGNELGRVESWQIAGDVVCGWLKDNPSAQFAYVHDTRPGMAYPFTRYARSDSPLCAWVGTPYKTLTHCLQGDDGGGFYVETYGGGVFTSVAWYENESAAHRHRASLMLSGSWSGMPPRVTRSCNR